MQNSNHSKFILSPIQKILQDTVNACRGIGEGIETQSLAEYVLQTTFLKMTGASEQKLKCICWEMATNDYEYRYQYLKKNYGECSSYKDKNSIYRDLVAMLGLLDNSFTINLLFQDIDISGKESELIEKKIKETIKKQEIKKNRKLDNAEIEKLSNGMRKYFQNKGICEKERAHFCRMVLFENIQNLVDTIVGTSLMVTWEQHNYKNYIDGWKSLSEWSFADGDNLLGTELQDFYTNVVYAHRNRCAHNLISIQSNLPSLKSLTAKRYIYDNYFYRFSIMILLDEIFVRLYRAYRTVVSKMEL